MVAGQPSEMRSHLGDALPKVEEEYSVIPKPLNDDYQKSLGTNTPKAADVVEQSVPNASNQLVIYNPSANCTGQDIVPVPGANDNHSTFQRSNRVLPSIGAFTVQCAECFNWRIIPTKEKYEEIRETILQEPFVCARAREWRPDISCKDPTDIAQDGSRLWAIDKPNIAQPPPRWERLLRIRGEGSTRFADVYYVAPCGKRLRSMVEIERYLYEHPEHIRSGVRLSQFSFQIPRPLQENYVRKRPQRPKNPSNDTGFGFQRPLEPSEVNPISWVAPLASADLQTGGPLFFGAQNDPPIQHSDPEQPPAKKKKKTTRPFIESHVERFKRQGTDNEETGNASPCDL